MESTTFTEDQKKAFLPYLQLISQQYETVGEETRKGIFLDAFQKPKEFMDLFEANFKASDANGDGVLNKEEFCTFEKKRREYETSKFKECLKFSDADYDVHYGHFNSLTPGVEGVSQQDLYVAMNIFTEITQAEFGGQ